MLGSKNWNQGPLRERPFRLLFAATTITTFGDRLATVALVFAVLELPGNGATQLGIVLAARQLVESGVVLAGGVLADRLPRSAVLVGASLLQGVAQAATAWYALSGGGSVWPFVALQALYGVGGGVVAPAEVGLIPQTVSADMLQAANALQGLARNINRVLGPSIAGVILVVAEPGVALAIDAASFFICALLLSRIVVAAFPAAPSAGFLSDLREGWTEFVARSWLVASVVLIGLANVLFMSGWLVLGPVIAERDLGGSGSWAFILACGGIGSVIGAFAAIRYRPRRPLFASSLLAAPLGAQLLTLALSAPVVVIASVSLVASAALSVALALWFTVFHQQIPAHMQSRLSSYDMLGSLVVVPAGMAAIGPIAATVGYERTLFVSTAAFLALMLWAAFLPSVRAIRPVTPASKEFTPTEQ